MYIDETNVLTRRFVKSTSSIGCVGAESNVPIDSNAWEPTRPCTSGIDYFGAEQLCYYFSTPRAAVYR